MLTSTFGLIFHVIGTVTKVTISYSYFVTRIVVFMFGNSIDFTATIPRARANRILHVIDFDGQTAISSTDRSIHIHSPISRARMSCPTSRCLSIIHIAVVGILELDDSDLLADLEHELSRW